MPESKFEAWASIINSVQTPLGFLVLITLILDGVLLASSATTEKISMLIPAGILVLLILVVMAISWKKPLALYHPKDWPIPNVIMTINLEFPINLEDVGNLEFDEERCTLEIHDINNNIIFKIKPNLTLGGGGWFFQVNENMSPTDSIRLELTEVNGRKWMLKPFAPYSIKQRVLVK